MDTLATSVVPKSHDRHDSGSQLKGDEEDVDTRRSLPGCSPNATEGICYGHNTNVYQTREVIVECEDRRPDEGHGEGGSIGSLGNEELASPSMPR